MEKTFDEVLEEVGGTVWPTKKQMDDHAEMKKEKVCVSEDLSVNNGSVELDISANKMFSDGIGQCVKFPKSKGKLQQ